MEGDSIWVLCSSPLSIATLFREKFLYTNLQRYLHGPAGNLCLPAAAECHPPVFFLVRSTRFSRSVAVCFLSRIDLSGFAKHILYMIAAG